MTDESALPSLCRIKRVVSETESHAILQTSCSIAAGEAHLLLVIEAQATPMRRHTPSRSQCTPYTIAGLDGSAG